MRRRRACHVGSMIVQGLGSVGLSILLIAAAGCAEVAASAAGGALVLAGGHVLSDSAEDVFALDIERIEELTADVLEELDVDVADTTRTREEGGVARCHIEGCLLGAEMVPVDVDLERVTSRMTRIRVSARSSAFHPEPAVSAEILGRIAHATTREAARSGE